ncbi:MAG TPA: ABC transporter substrate-binding protein [Devosia sp.]|nr:ABC transporter substrate-binding protein [Devosia sp.]
MRHSCSALLLSLLLMVVSGTMAGGFETEAQKVYGAREASGRTLRIISTADLDVFDPILVAFQAENPAIEIEYTIASTSELMKAISVEGAPFDLAISSAMDLQTKLANDGYAQTYRSAATDGLPQWARWRNQLFAFTQEPAVLILSEKEFGDGDIPATREDLINLLRSEPDRFRGRIGTYDVRVSGFGYLMATQDSRNTEAYWRLMEVMGRLDARLYCCSGAMIRDVANGTLALAYNVLGSYAGATPSAEGGGVKVVALRDLVNVMLRTALIPKNAGNPEDAHRLVDFLVSLSARPAIVARSGLPPIDDSVLKANNAIRPIRFGPGLLVFLDRQKRRNFLRSWVSSLEQE